MDSSKPEVQNERGGVGQLSYVLHLLTGLGFLLVFVLAHGINGLRQVVLDFVSSKKKIRLVNQASFVYWLVLTLIGLATLVGGVRNP